MTVVVTFQSENRFLPGPSGMGAKLVQGHLQIEPYSVALHAKDLRLNTIKALFFENYTIGSVVITEISAPGTYDNYASLTTYNLGTGEAPVAKAAGIFNAHFIAFGE